VEIDASASARRFILSRGGRVFVWFEDLNDAWMVQKVSTSAPVGGPSFDEYPEGDWALLLQRDFNAPDSIRLRYRPWWPLQPLGVTGTGAGVNLGGGSGDGDGWNWPHGGGGHGGGGGHDGGGHGGGH